MACRLTNSQESEGKRARRTYQQLRHLKQVCLDEYGLITDLGVGSVASLVRLQCLIFRGMWPDTLSDAGLACLGCLLQLKHLDISNWCKDITDRGFAGLSSLCHVEHLNLYGTGISNISIAPLFSSLHALRRLDLSFTNITDEGLSCLPSAAQLQWLRLDCCDITDSGLEAVSSLLQLQHLSIPACVSITDAGLCNAVRCLHHLQYLDISECREISDVIIDASSMMQLHFLSICRCARITDLSRLSSLRSLRHLLLEDNATDAALRSISCITELQHLDVDQHGKITSMGIAHVASLRQLTNLRLRGCKDVQVGDFGACFASLLLLQHLELSECNVRDADIASIVVLQLLRHLDLTKCMLITDVGVAFLSHLQQLEHLSLAYCQEITDAGLPPLASLPHLRAVDLYWCPKIRCDVWNPGVAALSGKGMRVNL